MHIILPVSGLKHEKTTETGLKTFNDVVHPRHAYKTKTDVHAYSIVYPLSSSDYLASTMYVYGRV